MPYCCARSSLYARAIDIVGGKSCVIANNTITGIGIDLLPFTHSAAINVGGGSSNRITNNSMTNNVCDICFTVTNNNFIVGNSIADGKEFWGASNNTIYHNNFVRGNQFYIDNYNSASSSGNVWDAGYPLGGNCWGDYLEKYPNATEIDSLGIGNTAYVSKILWWLPDYPVNDRYPLMEPYTEATYLLQTPPPKIVLLNQTVTGSNVSLAFTVTRLLTGWATAWMGSRT